MSKPLLERCFLARAEIAFPTDIAAILSSRPYQDLRRRLRENVLGPNTTEVFLTRVARDKALGHHGPFVEFIPTSWDEHRKAGLDITDIGVGHSIGQTGFATLAQTVVDAHAPRITRNGTPDPIVIARVTYLVCLSASGRITVGPMPRYGVVPDSDQTTATADWLRLAFGARLGSASSVSSLNEGAS